MKALFIAITFFSLTTLYTKPIKVSNATAVPPAYQPLKSFKGDTLKYIQTNFINNKAAYIHQPLSKLIAACEVPFKNYSSDLPLKAEFSSTFYLMTHNATQIYNSINKRKNPVTLVIHWETDVPTSEVTKNVNQDHGSWKGASKAYYQQQVVKDITLVNYGF